MQTSAGTLYRVRAGNFIYSRLFAFEGSYRLVARTEAIAAEITAVAGIAADEGDATARLSRDGIWNGHRRDRRR